jgi:hypothetical protein
MVYLLFYVIGLAVGIAAPHMPMWAMFFVGFAVGMLPPLLNLPNKK